MGTLQGFSDALWRQSCAPQHCCRICKGPAHSLWHERLFSSLTPNIMRRPLEQTAKGLKIASSPSDDSLLPKL